MSHALALLTRNDSSTVSPNTGQAVLDVPLAGVLPLDCPGLTDSEHEISYGDNRSWTFKAECGTRYAGDTVNVLALAAYTFQDCLRACVSLNWRADGADSADRPCDAIQFNAQLGLFTDPDGELSIDDDVRTDRPGYGPVTCWLQRDLGQSKKDKDKTSSNMHVSAKLL